MKQIVFFAFLLLGACALSAQSQEAKAPVGVGSTNTATDPAREAAERLVVKYGLNAEQAQKMYAIQSRKLRNLAEIEPFKTDNPALYRAKLESVQRGTQASIRRMLTGPAQLELFQKTQGEQRKLRQAKRQELRAQGASNEAIETAVQAIYME